MKISVKRLELAVLRFDSRKLVRDIEVPVPVK